MTHRCVAPVWLRSCLVLHLLLLGCGSETAGSEPVRGVTEPDFARHVRSLRRKYDLEGFHVVVQRPFVVVGDESPALVERRSKGTVWWCSYHLKRLYFPKPPKHIYTVWLFKDKASYRRHTKQFFGEAPDTPFGYCSHEHKALVMNIATGGGTLCHEIVHVFMESNFPDCPAWFGEGLASLYEQCRTKNGRLVGLTNWRLAGLQQAIAQGTVPSFRQLCSTTTREFYEEDPGTNYAQARYLCYYLQERGVLKEYYSAFHENVSSDPSGYVTLKRVLGVSSMAAWQADWEKWVLKLRFR